MRALGLALIAVLLWAGGAQARREETFPYPFSRVWTAAMRMVRVDYTSPITEKDKDSGYFLFEFPEAGKTYAGSAELIAVTENGSEQVRVVFQVPGLPSYVEQMMLDRLQRKLGQDYGEPRAPKPAPEPGKSAPPPPKGDTAPKTQAPKKAPG